MAKKNFDSADDIQTIFHMLESENKPNVNQAQISQACETILSCFQQFMNNPKTRTIINNFCLQTYKQSIYQILDDDGINLEEVPNYKLNLDFWVNFTKTIYLIIFKNQDKLRIENDDDVIQTLQATKTLDYAWKLKLDLYK